MMQVPVAKSTLSLWLRDVGLAKRQAQKLTKKRQEAGLKGALRRREARLQEISTLNDKGLQEVGNISARELWLIGTALYWAEGSKQKEHAVSTGVMFANSDARMIRVFLAWLRCVRIPISSIYVELYVHENRREEIAVFKKWWAQETKIPLKRFDRVYLKRDRPKTNRINTGDLYHGLLRIKVSSSTSLNRKINAWVDAVVAQLGDGVIGNTSAFGAEDSRFDP